MIVHGTPGKKTLCGYGFANDTEEQNAEKAFFAFFVGNTRKKGGHRSPVQTGRQSTEGNQASESERRKKAKVQVTQHREEGKNLFPRSSTSGTADGSTTYLLLQLLPPLLFRSQQQGEDEVDCDRVWAQERERGRERERERERGGGGGKRSLFNLMSFFRT